MDNFEVLSTLMKIILVVLAYVAVLGGGILTARWMGRRSRHRGGNYE